MAFKSLVRTIAIGAILGGGILGLLKMTPTFVSIFADIKKPSKEKKVMNLSKQKVGMNGL